MYVSKRILCKGFLQELQKLISLKLKKDLPELFYEKGVLNFAKFTGEHSVVVSF